jgi:glycosyltransferase involved in cell wall biosynthesis
MSEAVARPRSDSDDLAIAHTAIRTRGGAVRAVETLAEALDAPLYVGTDAVGTTARRLFDGWRGALTQRSDALGSVARLLAWQQDASALRRYETVVLSKTAPLWYRPPPEQTVVALAHNTPPQWYQQAHDGGWLAGLWRAGKRALFHASTDMPDIVVCNSELTERRVRQHWGVPDDRLRVVYPPVEIGQFDHDLARTRDEYLLLGRLAPDKRLVETASRIARSGRQVVLAGDGPLAADAREAARRHETLDYRGYVSERERSRLLSRARALVAPMEREDFGIVPAEALASGTPVLAVREGYPQHQITPGETGLRYDRGAVVAAIEELEREGVACSEPEIAATATRYRPQRFVDGMRAAISDARERARIEQRDADTPALEPEQAIAADGGEL